MYVPLKNFFERGIHMPPFDNIKEVYYESREEQEELEACGRRGIHSCANYDSIRFILRIPAGQ